MRKNAKWAWVPVGAVVVAALATAGFRAYGSVAEPDDLASDLALVAAAELEFAGNVPRAEVVSALEGGMRVGPLAAPAPRRKRGSAPPAPVEVKVKIAEVETPAPVVVMTPVSASLEPVVAPIPATDLPPLPRPRPMEPRFPVGDGGGWGTHGAEGPGTHPGGVGGPHPGDGTGWPVDPDVRRPTDGERRGGSIVIRGGSSGHDPCIPRSTGSVPRIGSVGVLINQRAPAGRTTFPRR